MKFTTLGFLTFVLWTAFVLSLLMIPTDGYRQELERVEEYTQTLPGVSRDPAKDHEKFYLRKLGRAINPAPHLFMAVISGGFLAVMRTQRLVGSIILDAIRSSPDATAEALRRVVKAKTP